MAVTDVAAPGRRATLEVEAPPANTPAHVPALDGVRGIAILVVVIYHFANSLDVLGVSSPLLKPVELGYAGVDVFFALSGFLITGILLDTKSSPYYFKSFYARRVLRIFPLYYLALLAVFLLRAALPDAGIWGAHDSPTSPGSLVWPVTFLQNAAIFFEGRGPTGVTTHYWSLAVEEHFYLVWPLLVWLTRARWQVLALALTAVGLSIAARGAIWLHGVDLNHVFGLTPFRMDGLAIGAAAAVLVRSHTPRQLAPWALGTLIGSVAALAGIVLVRHTMEQTDPLLWLLLYPLVSLASAAALIFSLSGGGFAAWLSTPILRWFGKYSFGLYVWHPIIGMLLFHSTIAPIQPGAPMAQVLVLAAFTFIVDLAVAWLCFQLWEKRFLALKVLFKPNGPAGASAAPADGLLDGAPVGRQGS